MNVDAVFVVIDCCYRLYDRFVVKLHACLPEKIDSYLILSSYLIFQELTETLSIKGLMVILGNKVFLNIVCEGG